MKQKKVVRYFWFNKVTGECFDETCMLGMLIAQAPMGEPIRGHIVGPLQKKLERMHAARGYEENLRSKDRKKVHTQFTRACEALGLVPYLLIVYFTKKGDPPWEEDDCGTTNAIIGSHENNRSTRNHQEP